METEESRNVAAVCLCIAAALTVIVYAIGGEPLVESLLFLMMARG